MHRRWWGRLTLSFLATLPDSNMKLWSCPLGLSDRIFPFPKWWQALVRSREKESTILGSYVPTSQLGNVPLKLLWPLTHSRNFVLEFLRLAVSIIVWLAWTRELGLFTRIWGPLGLHLPPRNNYMLFHWAALWAAVSSRSLQSALLTEPSILLVSKCQQMIRFTSRQIGPSLTDSRSTRKKPETLMKSSSAKWVQLTDFATDLAKLVVRDCEGATKFVMVTVKVDSYLFPWRLYLVAGCSL